MTRIVAKLDAQQLPTSVVNAMVVHALMIDRLLYLAVEIVGRSTNPVIIMMLVAMHLFQRDEGDGHLIFCPHFD
jgi:hypothetical protein